MNKSEQFKSNDDGLGIEGMSSLQTSHIYIMIKVLNYDSGISKNFYWKQCKDRDNMLLKWIS